MRPGQTASGVIGIQDREVVGLLILEDAGFGVHIGSEGAMTIQVIRRDVQDHSDFGTKGLNGLELETGDFENAS